MGCLKWWPERARLSNSNEFKQLQQIRNHSDSLLAAKMQQKSNSRTENSAHYLSPYAKFDNAPLVPSRPLG